MSYALHDLSTYSNRFVWAAHAVPGHGTEFASIVEQQNRRAVGRHHFEEKPKELPLQRVPVMDVSNPSGDFQQRIQVLRQARGGRQAYPVFFRLQRWWIRKVKDRSLIYIGSREFNCVAFDMSHVVLQQENQH